jgi:hypothetical protein
MQKRWQKRHKVTHTGTDRNCLIYFSIWINTMLGVTLADLTSCFPSRKRMRPTCYYLRRILLRSVNAYMDLPSTHLFMSIKRHTEYLPLLHITRHIGRTAWSRNGANTKDFEGPITPVTFRMTECTTCEKASRVAKNANYAHLLHYYSKIKCIRRNTNKHTPMFIINRQSYWLQQSCLPKRSYETWKQRTTTISLNLHQTYQHLNYSTVWVVYSHLFEDKYSER